MEECNIYKIYEIRWVVEGFQHKDVINFNEIYSHVVKRCRIRLALNIVVWQIIILRSRQDNIFYGDL